MDRNSSFIEVYEAPEVFELGEAAELTLGGPGSCSDGCGCYKCGSGGDEVM